MFRNNLMHLQILVAACFLCLTTSAVSIVKRQSLSTNAPSGWTYEGCYSDSVSNRVIDGSSYVNGSSMTEESCTTFCGNASYTFAGVEYAGTSNAEDMQRLSSHAKVLPADECYCGYGLKFSSTKEANSDCNMACSGNAAEACGAGNRLTVFTTGSAPATNLGPSGWTSLGCYSDSTSARTLRYSETGSGGSSALTIATCTAACKVCSTEFFENFSIPRCLPYVQRG